MTSQQLKTQTAGPEVSPGLLLWQVNNKWQAKQRRALLAFDLTHVQFVLLASLIWFVDQEGISQKQLADLAKTDIMMTSQVVRALEKKGFLTRTQHTKDARSYVLQPTERGIACANKAIQVVEEVDRQFFAALGTNVSNFIAMMQQLNI